MDTGHRGRPLKANDLERVLGRYSGDVQPDARRDGTDREEEMDKKAKTPKKPKQPKK